ncbi:hypothetical protein F5Y16DRAFT_404632 [Xylariaceae sp. FL0255]|nr:hypothetical protein F5Y16DRAFT_404632 [Xylariaceae sp. FL0255]
MSSQDTTHAASSHRRSTEILPRSPASLDPTRSSLATLPHVLLVILDHVDKDEYDSLALISSYFWYHINFRKYSIIAIRLDDAKSTAQKLGFINRMGLSMAVREIRVSAKPTDEFFDADKGPRIFEKQGWASLVLAKNINDLTGLKTLRWTLTRNTFPPFQVLKARKEHVKFELVCDPIELPSPESIESILAWLTNSGNQYLVSLALEVVLSGKIETKGWMRLLKDVLASGYCLHLVSLSINVTLSTRRETQKFMKILTSLLVSCSDLKRLPSLSVFCNELWDADDLDLPDPIDTKIEEECPMVYPDWFVGDNWEENFARYCGSSGKSDISVSRTNEHGIDVKDWAGPSTSEQKTALPSPKEYQYLDDTPGGLTLQELGFGAGDHTTGHLTANRVFWQQWRHMLDWSKLTKLNPISAALANHLAPELFSEVEDLTISQYFSPEETAAFLSKFPRGQLQSLKIQGYSWLDEKPELVTRFREKLQKLDIHQFSSKVSQVGGPSDFVTEEALIQFSKALPNLKELTIELDWDNDEGTSKLPYKKLVAIAQLPQIKVLELFLPLIASEKIGECSDTTRPPHDFVTGHAARKLFGDLRDLNKNIVRLTVHSDLISDSSPKSDWESEHYMSFVCTPTTPTPDERENGYDPIFIKCLQFDRKDNELLRRSLSDDYNLVSIKCCRVKGKHEELLRRSLSSPVSESTLSNGVGTRAWLCRKHYAMQVALLGPVSRSDWHRERDGHDDIGEVLEEVDRD